MINCLFNWNYKYPDESKQFLDDSLDYDGEIHVDTKNTDIQKRLLSTSLSSVIYDGYLEMKQTMKDIEEGLEAKKRQEKNLIKLIRKHNLIN